MQDCKHCAELEEEIKRLRAKLEFVAAWMDGMGYEKIAEGVRGELALTPKP